MKNKLDIIFENDSLNNIKCDDLENEIQNLEIELIDKNKIIQKQEIEMLDLYELKNEKLLLNHDFETNTKITELLQEN